MDELEISGKRYISTRRAAKDHKYSSDYIGQLIRGKKVLGQKVGRSWYVEEVSLADYLGKEKGEVPIKKNDEVFKIEETPEEVFVEKVEEVALKVVEAEVVMPVPKKVIPSEPIIKHVKFATQSRKEIIEEGAYRIPVSMKEKKGLVYLSDTEPSLPPIEKKKKRSVAVVNEESTPTPPAPIIEESHEEKTIFVVEKRSSSSPVLKSFVVLMVGVIVCGAVAAFSVSVSSSMIFEEGKSLTTRFSL